MASRPRGERRGLKRVNRDRPSQEEERENEKALLACHEGSGSKGRERIPIVKETK